MHRLRGVGEVRKRKGARDEEAEVEDEDKEDEWKGENEREREQDPEGNALRLQSSSAGPLIKGGPWENEFLEEGEGLRSTIDSLAASYKDRSRYGEACVPLKLFIVGFT